MTDLSIIEDLERKLQATDQIKKYIYAGRATFTLRSVATQKRMTFKMSKSKKSTEKDVFFLRLMYGNNNENDFRLIGVVKQGVYTPLRPRTPNSLNPMLHKHNKAIVWFLDQLKNAHLPATVEFWHSGRCGRCAKKLTVPESIAAGIGPECMRKM